ncbi:MAG: cytochrome c biogenesis protein ResB [Deltaproteobacteria bacterium]|nr:cytochrome c biogenesis protein ResB [Deltaproteobacteria bacterium]
MSTAIASTEPAVAPARSAEALARSELKVIAYLVGGLIAFGALVQQFVAAGPVAVVVYTTLMSVALIATSHLMRGRLLDAMSGFRLAAVVLAFLAAASALGTLVLQNRPAGLYQEKFGAIGRGILALRLDDLFHSLWFGGLVALLNAGLVTSALRRWPVTRRNLGFFMVHVGILVTLAGSAVSAVFGIKGKVDLRLGQTASTVMVTKAGLPTEPELPLGASVQLTKFDVDRWADVPRISLYMPRKKGTGFELKTTFENEVALSHRLPQGDSFRIKAYYPDLVMSERLVESGGSTPALKLTVDGQETFLMPEERPRIDTRDGAVAVLFGWQRPAAKLDAPLHTIKVGEAEPLAVRPGETAKLANGTEVRVLRYFPHFTYDIAKKQAMNVSATPINPALEVEMGGTKKWLFANMPGFGHDGKEGPQLVYAFSPEGGTAAATVIAVGAADRSVLVRNPDGTEATQPLQNGLEIAGIKLGSLHEKAALVREPRTASQEMKKPAVLVELTEKGRTREVLLTAGSNSPVEIGKGFLAFETATNDVKAFRSELAVQDGAGPKRKEIVAVNDPVPVGSWLLYQVNYDPKDLSYSGLEAVRDPGVSWVFLGFVLLFFGVCYMLYVAPRLRRREA